MRTCVRVLGTAACVAVAWGVGESRASARAPGAGETPDTAEVSDRPQAAPSEAAPSEAAPPETATLEAAPREAEARAAWLAGRAALADGRPEHALIAFERAQELDPSPARLLRIARVLEILGRYEEAAARYEAWLAAAPGDARRSEVQQALEAARARIRPVLVLEGLDLSDAGDDDGETPAGGATRSADALRPVRGAEGAETAVPLAVRLEEPVPPPASEAPAAGEAPLARRWWFWAGVGGAAAVVVTGLAVAGGGAGESLPAGTLGTIDRRGR